MGSRSSEPVLQVCEEPAWTVTGGGPAPDLCPSDALKTFNFMRSSLECLSEARLSEVLQRVCVPHTPLPALPLKNSQ